MKSTAPKCRKGRIVVLKKKTPGKDKKIGSDITNPEGNYEISKRNANGVYYTTAFKKTFMDRSGREVTCQKDRSPNEKV